MHSPDSKPSSRGGFPKAEQLIRKMELEQTYKDVTFETLNKPDFLSFIVNAGRNPHFFGGT